MIRLTKNQIGQIIKMTEDGKSLNYISGELKIKKTTVYYHFLKIRGRTNIKPTLKFSNDKELGEIIGIFTGDGSLSYIPKRYGYQVRVHFGKVNIDYMWYVKSLFEKCFGKKFLVKNSGKNGVIIETMSKDIFNFFFRDLNFNRHCKSKTVYLKSNKYSELFLIGFLKGLIDTDGSICDTKNGRYMSFYTSSKKLKNQFCDVLNKINILHGVSEDRRKKESINYRVYIFRRDINKLLSIIKPYKGRYINPVDYLIGVQKAVGSNPARSILIWI